MLNDESKPEAADDVVGTAKISTEPVRELVWRRGEFKVKEEFRMTGAFKRPSPMKLYGIANGKRTRGPKELFGK